MSGHLPTDKHTKGPWYVGAMNDRLFIIDAPPRPSTDDIVFGGSGPKVIVAMPGDGGPEEEANAFLLATAPDGLTLARSIVWEMETFGRVSMGTYQEARGLITKATAHREPPNP